MPNPIAPLITEAGLQAVFNASEDGLKATISHIGWGDGSWDADSEATALLSEKQRFAVIEGAQDGTSLHLSALAGDLSVNEEGFFVKEVGFFLDDGTLFAVWANKEKTLGFKAPLIDWHVSWTLVLSALPSESVTVNVITASSNLSLSKELLQVATASIKQMTQIAVQEVRFVNKEQAT